MPVYELKEENGKVVKNLVSNKKEEVIYAEPASIVKCDNCNTEISCGCQIRVASDGKEVCDECIDRYEGSLKK